MKTGFAAPPIFLSDEKIQTMSAAELRAEAHQRGWDMGAHTGDRAARVKFWQLQQTFMPQPPALQGNDPETPEIVATEEPKLGLDETDEGLKDASLEISPSETADTPVETAKDANKEIPETEELELPPPETDDSGNTP